MPSSTFCPGSRRSEMLTCRLCSVCGPSSLSTRAPHPEREWQLLHPACVSQRSDATPSCHETTVAHSFIMRLPSNLFCREHDAVSDTFGGGRRQFADDSNFIAITYFCLHRSAAAGHFGDPCREPFHLPCKLHLLGSR